jgi:putative transposase
MKGLYELAGTSRQAHHRACQRHQEHTSRNRELLEEVRTVRVAHPRMGMAKLHDLLQPPDMGRDKFIKLLKDNDLQLNKVRNYRRTTYSNPHSAFRNLIQGMKLDGPNQLWVSDITYFHSGPKHYYLTFILDVYSRRIVGYAASDSLAAQANMKALRRALRLRGDQSLKGLIHHSDRGVQYIYHKYVNLLRNKGIRISMGNKAWENAHAERINRTIKNDYLYAKGSIRSLKSLQEKLKEQVDLYNQQRPHQELPNRTNPVAFEQLAAQKQLDYQVKINY